MHEWQQIQRRLKKNWPEIRLHLPKGWQKLDTNRRMFYESVLARVYWNLQLRTSLNQVFGLKKRVHKQWVRKEDIPPYPECSEFCLLITKACPKGSQSGPLLKMWARHLQLAQVEIPIWREAFRRCHYGEQPPGLRKAQAGMLMTSDWFKGMEKCLNDKLHRG